jgi:hypothetical protein
VGTRRSVSRRTEDVVGDAFFLGVVGFVQLCGNNMKGCHVRGLHARSIHRAYVNWRGKHTCRVDRVFPCRVYIDSNHRDSRI